MLTKDNINTQIDKIENMLSNLRTDMYTRYSFKKFGHHGLAKFNEISWELSCLKNLIKEL